MKTSIYLFALVATLFLGSSFTSVNNHMRIWKKLGTKKVSYGLDRDVIHVGLKDGVFNKLKVQVTGGALNMHKMVIEYGNGAKENVNLKHNFPQGGGTRVIDINGNNRVIKDITFWYDTKNISRKKAKVHVFGRK